MALRRNWADRITAAKDGDSLILTGIRMALAGSDLLKEDYAKTKAEKGGEALHMHFSHLSNTRQILSYSLRYGPFYGELAQHKCLYMRTEQEHVSEDDEESTEDLDNPPSERIAVRQPNSLVLQEAAALRAFLALLEPAKKFDTKTEVLSRIEEEQILSRIEEKQARRQEEEEQALSPAEEKKARKQREEEKAEALSRTKEKKVHRRIHGQLSVLADQTKRWQHQLATEIAVRNGMGIAPDTGWLWSSVAQERVESARDFFSFLCNLPADDENSWTVAAFMGDPESRLRFVVATVLNAFAPALNWDFSGIVLHSGADLIFGIRPLIYHMIREDLLAGSEIKICRNKSCGRFFQADRRDQTCCTPECSERVRYRKYYETKRKPERQARSTANAKRTNARKV